MKSDWPGDQDRDWDRDRDDDRDYRRRNRGHDDDYYRDRDRGRPSDDDSDLTTGEWVACIFCSGIACIVGIVWLIQGKPKAGKMIGISLLFAILWNVIRFVVLKDKFE
jgi:hypothetical protein